VTEVGCFATGGVASLGRASGQGKKKNSVGWETLPHKAQVGLCTRSCDGHQGNEVTDVALIEDSISSHSDLSWSWHIGVFWRDGNGFSSVEVRRDYIRGGRRPTGDNKHIVDDNIRHLLASLICEEVTLSLEVSALP